MPGLDDLDVPEITRRIAAGDREAFARFYEAAFDHCYARARVLSGRDESFCLDAVQEVMLKAIRRLPRLADRRALRAWLDRTVLHTVVDLFRRELRRHRRERACGRPEADTADARLLLENAETRAWLTAQLASLPPLDRALFAARFGDGLTLADCGARVGLSGDAAHGRLRRALLALRRKAREVFG